MRKQWVRCISSHYQQFQGRLEKEVRLITAELIKRKRDQGKDLTVTDKELAQFLSSTEMKEGKFLEQRLRTVENKSVIQKSGVLEGDRSINNIDSFDSALSPVAPTEHELDKSDDYEDRQNTNGSEDLEFYGEY